MKAWMRNTLLIAGAVLLVLGAAYYWFLVENHEPEAAHFVIDVEALRRLSGAMSGERPTAIEAEHIGTFHFPAILVVAGDGWNSIELPVLSYRLVFPHTTAIIDTALTPAMGGSNLTDFDAAAYERMQQAMARASLIVVTHEHVDHIGGLTAHQNLATLVLSMRLTREQLAHLDKAAPAKFPAGALDGITPLDYQKYLAIAPGVVLVKSPGHTPGSQMVYVRTAQDEEFLFAGDVAWRQRNIQTQHERARLTTQFFLNEDRTAVFGELTALKRTQRTDPRIHVIPGHDGQVIDELVTSGLMRRGFSVE